MKPGRSHPSMLPPYAASCCMSVVCRQKLTLFPAGALREAFDVAIAFKKHAVIDLLPTGMFKVLVYCFERSCKFGS